MARRWRAALALVFWAVLGACIYDATVNHNPDAKVGIVMAAAGAVGWTGLWRLAKENS